MHENNKNCKSESSATASPKTLERGGKEISKGKRDTCDISEKIELEVPENFSEMERQIFIAHKNAIEVQ